MRTFKRRYLGKSYGGYTIQSVLGEGRYGVCFLASAPGQPPVVLKRFKTGMRKKNDRNNHFEAVILSQLQHPAIPELLGVIHEGDDYFFVLEHMPGHSIEKWIFRRHWKFSDSEIGVIGGQLIDILVYLQEQSIVHRDIRTSNVLFDGKTVSLVDFGLARFQGEGRLRADIDYSYLGDFFLYLFYSSYKGGFCRRKPWYEELPLTAGQQFFLKRLLGLEAPFSAPGEIKEAFRQFG